jgi:hypothetical protein
VSAPRRSILCGKVTLAWNECLGGYYYETESISVEIESFARLTNWVGKVRLRKEYIDINKTPTRDTPELAAADLCVILHKLADIFSPWGAL